MDGHKSCDLISRTVLHLMPPIRPTDSLASAALAEPWVSVERVAGHTTEPPLARQLSEDEICEDCDGPDTYYGCQDCEDEDHFMIKEEQMAPNGLPAVVPRSLQGDQDLRQLDQERVEHAVMQQQPMKHLDTIQRQMRKRSNRVGPVRGFTFEDTPYFNIISPPPPPQVSSYQVEPATGVAAGAAAGMLAGAVVALGAVAAVRRRRRAVHVGDPPIHLVSSGTHMSK